VQTEVSNLLFICSKGLFYVLMYRLFKGNGLFPNPDFGEMLKKAAEGNQTI